ncbi:hypothetical protein [Rhodocyclus tenuis]|uniref:Uncharacterized protein n=1 Tax=Rhodocyclus tenuis TaxID=1066 RepID=A0A840GA20_RHOTE|nr:hypothetical protein [Rhodocyclus tenuis]MBB4249173.1 hypothetical protein [Rhodocyclus tenuis]
MHPDHLRFAQQSLASFIDVAIQRIAFSGESVYRYTISANSIKDAACLTRLKNSVIQDYESYFAMMGVTAMYNEAFDVLNITLNLNTCVLTPQQSDALTIAMSTFRVEHM